MNLRMFKNAFLHFTGQLKSEETDDPIVKDPLFWNRRMAHGMLLVASDQIILSPLHSHASHVIPNNDNEQNVERSFLGLNIVCFVSSFV